MASSPEQLAGRLVESYEQVGGINHWNGVSLPSKREVGEVTRVFLRLLFPGYYQSDDFGRGTLGAETGERVAWICEHLQPEVAKSIGFRVPAGWAHLGGEQAAGEIVCRLLGGLPQLREVLRGDVEAAFAGDPAATCYEEIILAYPGLEAVAVQRLAHLLYSEGVALIPRMMTEWAHSRTGIDIHPGARLGPSFFIDHGTGVVIGETTQIGNRVRIYHGVTLGARSTTGVEDLRGCKRHPTIEDDVTIYPGATILGGETVIGRGSIINGNVFLMESVPPFSRVGYEQRALVITPRKEQMPGRGGE